MTHILMHYTTNWNKITEITIPILQEYADRHGYRLSVMELLPYEKYNGIPKLSQILSVLEEGDVALVLDADAVITNHRIFIEPFLGNKHDIYLSEGMNMGVFIIRLTNFTRKVLQFLINGISKGDYHCEQDGMEYLLKEANIGDSVKIVPHPCFNSYLSELYPEVPQPVTEQQGQWKIGSYILHLPALSIDKRVEILKSTPIKR